MRHKAQEPFECFKEPRLTEPGECQLHKRACGKSNKTLQLTMILTQCVHTAQNSLDSCLTPLEKPNFRWITGLNLVSKAKKLTEQHRTYP